MSAQIIQFPRPCRRRPFDRVHVLPGEDGEVWCIAGSSGWLHTNWHEAVEDAVDVAAGYGVPIEINHHGRLQ